MSPRLDPEEQAAAEQVGRNLKRCRKYADLSTEQVGRRAELSRTGVWLIERGKRLPKLDTVLRLAGALGVEPEELIRGLAWRRPTRKRPGGLYIRGRRASPP